MKKTLQKGFIKNYSYMMEYKRYYKSKPAIYKQIKFQVFVMETLLNLFYLWNKVITKDTSKSKLFINTDNLFFDIERYF